MFLQVMRDYIAQGVNGLVSVQCVNLSYCQNYLGSSLEGTVNGNKVWLGKVDIVLISIQLKNSYLFLLELLFSE